MVDRLGAPVPGLAEGDVVWGIWGHRSYAVVPADRLLGHVLPDGLDPVVGTFDRVGAVALNAVLAAESCIGEIVAVFGQGVIGLLATQLLVGQGIEVLAIDTQPARLELAERFGARPISALDGDVALAIRKLTDDRCADRVIELTGSYSALHEAIRCAGVDGTVVAGRVLSGTGDRAGPRRGVPPQPGSAGQLPDRRAAARTAGPVESGAAARDGDPALRQRPA